MEQLHTQLIRMEEKLEAILIQTTKTNGRVDMLSEKTENHDGIIKELVATNNQTKGRDKMIWIFLSALGAVSLVLIGYFISK